MFFWRRLIGGAPALHLEIWRREVEAGRGRLLSECGKLFSSRGKLIPPGETFISRRGKLFSAPEMSFPGLGKLFSPEEKLFPGPQESFSPARKVIPQPEKGFSGVKELSSDPRGLTCITRRSTARRTNGSSRASRRPRPWRTWNSATCEVEDLDLEAALGFARHVLTRTYALWGGGGRQPEDTASRPSSSPGGSPPTAYCGRNRMMRAARLEGEWHSHGRLYP